MALSSTLVWEVRTTGGDTQGGAFRAGATGSDFSQQDAAQITYSDLVIGGTNTQLTSAAFPFGAAHVGNLINVTGGTGFTVGRYEVVSVAGVVATMDRAVGTAASTGGAGKLGGALASPGMVAGAKVTGNDVWIKSGTYTLSATANVAGGRVNETTGTCRWIGYGATRGDLGTRPILRAGAGSMVLFTYSNDFVWVDNLEFKRDTASGFTGIQALNNPGWQRARVKRCLFTQVDNLAWNTAGTASMVFADCELVGCTSPTVWLASTVSLVERCVAHGSVGAGDNGAFYGPSAGTTFVDCLAYGNVGRGFDTVGAVINGVAYNNTTDGIALNQALANAVNCLSVGNGRYGFRNGAIASNIPFVALENCAAFNNATANYNVFTTSAVEGTITLTADPFVNAAGGDFSLNNTAGGGALLRGAGLPQSFVGTTTTSRPDVGVSQHIDGSGGGGPINFAY